MSSGAVEAAPPEDQRAPSRPPVRRPSGWQWALLGVVALAIVGLGAALLLRSDDEPTSDPTAGTAGDVEQAQDEGSDPATDPETDATAPDAGEITDDATPVVSLPPVVVMVVRDGSRVVVLDTATGETRTLLEQPEADPDDPLPPNGFGRVILDPVADVVFVEEIGEPAAGVVRRVPLGGGEPDAVALGSYPALSPDGARLATADIGGGISILELDGGDRTELDGEPDASGLGAVNLAWGHDGRTLWFERITDVGGSSELWRVDALSASSLDDAVLVGPADDDQSWTLPAPRADGEVVVIEQCCTLTRPRGSANGVVIDATTGDVTSTFLLERGVFDAAYDSSGSFFLYVLVDGTVRWQGGGQGGQLATGASTADW